MGMREEIEALPRYGCDFEYVRIADLRRIIDKHAAPVVDMTSGMQPRQPSKDVGELPSWLRELERLEDQDRAVGLIAAPGVKLLRLLRELNSLRCVILSGKGKALVPPGVIKVMHPDSDIYPCSGGEFVFRSEDDIMEAGDLELHEIPAFLAAINSYANSLINP